MLKPRLVSILLPILVGSLALVAALVTLHRRAVESPRRLQVEPVTKQNAELKRRLTVVGAKIQILSATQGPERRWRRTPRWDADRVSYRWKH